MPGGFTFNQFLIVDDEDVRSVQAKVVWSDDTMVGFEFSATQLPIG